MDEDLLILLAPNIETDENRKLDMQNQITERSIYQENSFLDPININEYIPWNSTYYMDLDRINRTGKG